MILEVQPLAELKIAVTESERGDWILGNDHFQQMTCMFFSLVSEEMA